MKKIIIPAVIVVLALGAFLLTAKNETKTFEPLASDVSKKTVITPAVTGEKTIPTAPTDTEEVATDPDLENFYDEEILPATDVYPSAREAYDKIMASIKSYDDIVLEQFAGLNASNCTWCPELFASLKETMLGAKDEDTKGYLAELLAITGDQGNIETILEAYKNGSESDQEIYLESLEMTAGDDSLVTFLDGKIEGAAEPLKESLIAAISNHGSLAAVESLYAQTKAKGDPNGYYDYGMGLGEVIPDAAALPTLIDIANQKDDYSHLAVKALLNYGDDGLREVFNIIGSSNDTGLNNRLLADAIDHVSFDEETGALLDEIIANNPNPDVQKFANEIKEEMAYEESDSEADLAEEEE